MKNKIVVFFITALISAPLALGLGAFSASADEIVDVGNKFCPVSGNPVDGENFVVHEGKRYGLCCAGCEKMFLQNPEKYLPKTEEQEPEPTES